MALHIAPPGQRWDPDPAIEMFTVIKPLNLNNTIAFIVGLHCYIIARRSYYLLIFQKPIEILKVARFTFGFNRLCVSFWWKKGDLRIFGRLPVSGYCSGQIMNLKLNVINQSGQGVLMVLVHFIKVIEMATTFTIKNNT